MESITLIGRGSRLSLVQIEKVKEKILAAFPYTRVEIKTMSSRGDNLPDVPLHTVEGSDFFTQEIFHALETGEADIAVHSLKDMSAAHFFGKNLFAVVDRDDVRDIAIFRDDIEDKLRVGGKIIIGTCSPRREEMAIEFLQQALPQIGSFTIETKSIRGNIDTRIKKLDSGEYDGIILATAGLNRLQLPLKNKKLMLLPLIDCVPAPCQGAIVAEALASNKKATQYLQSINEKSLHTDCVAEKKLALSYGLGCLQKFGVATIQTKNGKFLYAAGSDSNNDQFSSWYPLPGIKIDYNNLFSSVEHMKDFFRYEWKDNVRIKQPVVFIANHKAIHAEIIKDKQLIVSGTKTWFALSKLGYWITASADGLGFEFLLPSLSMPLFKFTEDDICILTHEEAAARWKQKGYNAVANYRLIPTHDHAVREKISMADAVFWTSFSQYQYYGNSCKRGVIHFSPAGETASLLKEQGIDPFIFPTIKAFEEWRKTSIRLHNVA